MTGSFHISLFEGTRHVDKIHVWFKIANITHVLPVPDYQQTDFTPKCVVVSRLHDTVNEPEWISHPGKTTRVNSRRGDSRRHDILCWYHVNKCRAIRGNRSELTPAWKLPPVSCKQPLRHSCYTCNINHTGTSCLNIGLGYPSYESLFIGKVKMEITF